MGRTAGSGSVLESQVVLRLVGERYSCRVSVVWFRYGGYDRTVGPQELYLQSAGHGLQPARRLGSRKAAGVF